MGLYDYWIIFTESWQAHHSLINTSPRFTSTIEWEVVRSVKESGDFALYRSISSLLSSRDDTLVFSPSVYVFHLSNPPSFSLRSEKVSRDAISPRGHSFSSELLNEPYQSRYYFFLRARWSARNMPSFVYKRLN